MELIKVVNIISASSACWMLAKYIAVRAGKEAQQEIEA